MEQGPLIEIGLPAALFLIMVGMGMTLTPRDFREVLVAPRATLFGLVAQVILMPLLALSLIHISEPTRRRGISYAVFCLKKKK